MSRKTCTPRSLYVNCWAVQSVICIVSILLHLSLVYLSKLRAYYMQGQMSTLELQGKYNVCNAD